MEFLKNVKRICCDAGLEPGVFDTIKDDVLESNRKAVMIYSLIAFGILFILTLVACFSISLNRYIAEYVISVIPMGIVLYISAFRAKGKNNIIISLMYFLIGYLLLFAIILGTYSSKNELASTYIALLLTIPQMFTDRPVRMYIPVIISIIVFNIIALFVKGPAVRSIDLTNSLVFGFVSIVCSTFTMNFKAERFSLVEKVKYLAETDQLTGLKNRNCYEVLLKNPMDLSGRVAFCIYVDVNGLHELNNAMGHAAGDKMLKYVAKSMQTLFGTEHTYRLGGDEYLALGFDLAEDSLEERVSQLRQMVNSAGYHIAVGTDMAYNGERSIKELTDTAEKRMYEDKTAYYSSGKADRRCPGSSGSRA